LGNGKDLEGSCQICSACVVSEAVSEAVKAQTAGVQGGLQELRQDVEIEARIDTLEEKHRKKRKDNLRFVEISVLSNTYLLGY
jgi:hypothetical protein